MESNILSKANIKIKNKYPIESNKLENFCTIFSAENILQINFESKGCKNSYSGSCIMCDYGRGINISKEEVIHAFHYAINSIKTLPKTLLVNTYGSILDEFEFSTENLITLLKEIDNTNFKNVIFETHYKTINKEKIELIKSYLKDKNIYFEIGIESFNEKYRKYCLNKEINNGELLGVIKLIKEKNCFIIANLLIGIPFLSTKEQLNDSINSIEICIENGINEITLFPVNIKEHTLLYYLYKNNIYQPISHWLVIEILNNIPKEYLEKISFAWYGNRDEGYLNNKIIFPKSCDICKGDIQVFYNKFNSSNGKEKNKSARIYINEISDKCRCKTELKEDLEKKNSEKFEDRVNKIYDFIEESLIKGEI